MKAQSNLVGELHAEEFTFVIPRRFQSDPLEKRFAQYQQMNGGRFLVSLRKVESSEKILLIRSLFKEDINFWDEDIQIKKSVTQDFLQHIARKNVELSSVILKKDRGCLHHCWVGSRKVDKAINMFRIWGDLDRKSHRNAVFSIIVP